MNNLNFTKCIVLFSVLILLFSACKKEECEDRDCGDNGIATADVVFGTCTCVCNEGFILGPDGDCVADGIEEESLKVIIVNEGLFGAGNGSISVLDVDSDDIENNVFESANSFLLGDVVQNIHWEGEEAFIAVNNSQKIEVVNADDFSSSRTYSDLGSVNDLLVADNTQLFYTKLFDENVELVSANDGSAIATLELDCPQPEETQYNCGNNSLLALDGMVYIGNSGTGALLRTSSAGAEITADDIIDLAGAPKDIVADANGNLWVLTFDFGDAANNTLYHIDPISYSIVSETPVGNMPYASVNMVIDEAASTLYFNEGDITSMGIDGSFDGRETVYSNVEEEVVYGFGIDPDASFLYLGFSGDFTNPGPGQVAKISASDGTEAARYDVGFFPSKFYFR